MTNLLMQVTLPNTNGLAEDAFVNTFAFGSSFPVSAADRLSVMQELAAFYTDVPTGGLAAVGNWLSDVVTRAPASCLIDCFDISGNEDGSPHGSPIDGLNFTLPAANSVTSMPSEVAYVVTLEAEGRAAALVEVPDGADADAAVDRPKQRRTGRLYLGPFTINTLDGGVGRPDVALRDTVRMAADDLATNVDALGSFGVGDGWAVWSRKDAVLRKITHVSLDDAWDTQRRRGVGASVRNRYAVG